MGREGGGGGGGGDGSPGEGGGGGHPDPKIRRGRGRPPEKFFSALRASFWSKNKGGGRVPRAPPLDPPMK